LWGAVVICRGCAGVVGCACIEGCCRRGQWVYGTGVGGGGMGYDCKKRVCRCVGGGNIAA
jgi:hypothetical protein